MLGEIGVIYKTVEVESSRLEVAPQAGLEPATQ
jgi:hypothetical protein